MKPRVYKVAAPYQYTRECPWRVNVGGTVQYFPSWWGAVRHALACAGANPRRSR